MIIVKCLGATINVVIRINTSGVAGTSIDIIIVIIVCYCTALNIIICVSDRTTHHVIIIVCDCSICGVLINICYCTTLHIVVIVIVSYSTAVDIIVCVNVGAVNRAVARGRTCASAVIICCNRTSAI